MEFSRGKRLSAGTAEAVVSTKRHQEQALLFVGVLYSSAEVFERNLPELENLFGRVLLRSPVMAWDHSHYYRDELGVPIFRIFIFFERCIDAALLPDIKVSTEELELRNLKDGRRQINLDPGYLTEAKVILASTKNYSHRIYLGRGIYAEQEYIFSKGRYLPLAHTYTDYRKQEYLDIFHQARRQFRELVADRKATG
ncbi:MAG: DUF4416 domain-containing protein [Thermodesulfovibrio sp.]|nr:DUF4416 domain-containing protein [Thermodesulfovibrio sp.]